MKLLKKLTIAALSLAIADLATAQTTINIVGSNGDRAATQAAIDHLLGSGTGSLGNWNFQGDKGYANKTGATLTKESNALNSNYGVWNGSYSGSSVLIKVSFIGAAGAIAALATPAQARFVASVGTGTATLNSPYAAGAVLGTDYVLAFPNFGFSTNFQETTPFSGGSYDTLTAETVGISPIVFVASPGFPGNNITSQLAQNLYGGGSLPISLFTGTSGDQNKIAYAIGRNTDAGQRYATYAEVGLGAAATVFDWQPTIAGQLTDAGGIKYAGTATSQQLWPIETISGINSFSRGNSGYDTGGNLAPALTTVLASNVYKGIDAGGDPTPLYPNATAGYYIGYLTIGDYNSRIAVQSPTSVLLQYNGVTYTEDAVRQGKYTLWVYNRILEPSAGLGTGIVNSFHDSLRNQILNVDAVQNGGIRVNDVSHPVNVQRFTDGGLVVPTF